MTDATNPFESELAPRPANHEPLSPLSFLARAAAVFPSHTAVIHGEERYTWAEAEDRCRLLASALAGRGIGLGDTVAAMLPNTPPLFEAHFGVPMAGAVLNALNVRLDPATIANILDHGEAKALITDQTYAATVKAALARLGREILVIDVDDPQRLADEDPGERLGEMDYEAFLSSADPDRSWQPPADEWQAIALNARQHPGLEPEAPSGLPLDPAHVSLQRLVLSLDRHRPGRHPSVPAPGRGRCDLPGHRRAQGLAPLRRAHRHADDPGGRSPGASGFRPPGAHDDRRCAAAGPGAGRHGRGRYRSDPCLWPDRGLWPGRGLRLA
jgi:hypothetical protein